MSKEYTFKVRWEERRIHTATVTVSAEALAPFADRDPDPVIQFQEALMDGVIDLPRDPDAKLVESDDYWPAAEADIERVEP